MLTDINWGVAFFFLLSSNFKMSVGCNTSLLFCCRCFNFSPSLSNGFGVNHAGLLFSYRHVFQRPLLACHRKVSLCMKINHLNISGSSCTVSLVVSGVDKFVFRNRNVKFHENPLGGSRIISGWHRRWRAEKKDNANSRFWQLCFETCLKTAGLTCYRLKCCMVVVKFSCGHAVCNRKLMQSVDSILFAQCSDGGNTPFFVMYVSTEL
jgi:hypothetical protein